MHMHLYVFHIILGKYKVILFLEALLNTYGNNCPVLFLCQPSSLLPGRNHSLFFHSTVIIFFSSHSVLNTMLGCHL